MHPRRAPIDIVLQRGPRKAAVAFHLLRYFRRHQFGRVQSEIGVVILCNKCHEAERKSIAVKVDEAAKSDEQQELVLLGEL